MNREIRIANRLVVAATFGQFEQMLRQHDWTYAYSDDGGVFRAGENQANRIEEMAKELVEVDAKRTVELYNKYGREGWGREWKEVGADRWIDLNKREAEATRLHLELEKEVRGFGRILGKVIKGEWYEVDIRMSPTFYIVIRGNDGVEWQVSISGWMGGTHLAIYKGGWMVLQGSIDGKYYKNANGGLRPEMVRQKLDSMYRDLVQRGVID